MITGSNGFIAPYVIDQLNRDSNNTVIALSHSSVYYSGYSNVINVSGDILDADFVNKLYSQFRPEITIHLAGIASPVYSDISALYDCNVRGTENLLSAASANSEGSKFVLFSTAGVYGNNEFSRSSKVNDHYSPINHYAISKMAAELIAKTYTSALQVGIIRPFNIIGCGQSTKFLVPKLVASFVAKQKEVKVGNLNTYRDYVDVRDAAIITKKFVESDYNNFEIINICSGIPTSGVQLLEYLEEITGWKPEIHVDGNHVRRAEIFRLVGESPFCEQFSLNSVKTILKDMVAKTALREEH